MVFVVSLMLKTETEGFDEVLAIARARRRLPSPRRCRQIRERAGISQQAVARAIGGVSRETVTRWESGVRRPGPRVIDRYIALLDRLVAETWIKPA